VFIHSFSLLCTFNLSRLVKLVTFCAQSVSVLMNVLAGLALNRLDLKLPGDRTIHEEVDYVCLYSIFSLIAC